MKEELKYALSKYGETLNKLKEGTEQTKDELDKDGVIQRFEFTFEQLWKTLKIFLEEQGLESRTPKESLKEAFKINLIDDEETFLNMLEDRNRTSHTYDKNIAEEIFEKIKNNYVASLEKVLTQLEKWDSK